MTCYKKIPEDIEKMLSEVGTTSELSLPNFEQNDILCQEIMGQVLTLSDWREFLGVPAKSTVLVRYILPNKIRVFSPDCPFLRSAEEPYEILIKKSLDTHKVTAFIQALYLKEEAPSGLGTAIISKMLLTVHNKYPKINRFKLYAAKAPRYGGIAPIAGYYFWGRIGFDGKIIPTTAYDQKTFPEILNKSQFKQNEVLSDFFSTEAGRKWWRRNGIALELEFDPHSFTQINNLQNYLKERSEKQFAK